MISLLIASAIAAAQPGIAPSEPSPYFLDSSTILQVTCPTKIKNDDGSVEDGSYLGTAFYVGNGQWVTARHIVRDEDSPDKHLFPLCTMAGLPIKVLDIGKGFVDYALFSAPLQMPFRAILSCDGLQQGKTYYATGYADGNPWQVTQRIVASGSRTYEPGAGNNEATVRGNTIEGQSGGPVVDERGVVVGLVSAGEENGIPLSMVLSLSDTPLCKATRK